MALTINTNISSMIAQGSFNKASKSLNSAIEKMTTGYKLNHASDNAAGYSIATNWKNEISSLDVAADNAATGADLLKTLEDTYALINTHLQRVRDLTEQAANGTYSTQSLKAINAEITARLAEIDRISENCEFGGLNLMDGSLDEGINLQVGLDDQDRSKIKLDAQLFQKASVSILFGEDSATIASKCAGLKDGTKASAMLPEIDEVINEISQRVTTLGAAGNRVSSAIDSIEVQTENITSSLSTLQDADIAEESSNYLKAQILQQAAATLLATANQTPSIALNLV